MIVMTTPTVIPLTPAQFAAAKRCQSLSLRELLSAGAKHSQGSDILRERIAR